MKQIRDWLLSAADWCMQNLALVILGAVLIFALIMGSFASRSSKQVIRINGKVSIEMSPGSSIDFGGARIEWWNSGTNQPEQDVNPAPRE